MSIRSLPMPTGPEIISTDIRVVNALGVCLHTFSDPDLAILWARAKTPEFGELTVEEVVTYRTRRRLYRPRVAPMALVGGRAG